MAFLGCVTLLLLAGKKDIHLFINGLHHPFFDGFFRVVTEFGAFPLIAFITVCTLFVRFRITLTVCVSSLFASIMTQMGKRIIWPDSPRPKVLFSDHDPFHFVDGVHLHSSHSFPSGHTSGAFALFIVLALYAKQPWLKVLLLLCAVLVAYSRMYLSQHFLVDVTVGSLIGVIFSILAYLWLNARVFSERRGLDNRLMLRRPWIG